MSLHHARSSALLVALCVGAAVIPSSLRAQQMQGADSRSVLDPAVTVAAPVQGAAAVPATVVGPRAIPAGVTTTTQAAAWDVARGQDNDRSVGAGTNLALMGVGAAAVVIGLLVGGDGGAVIAVGGGVVALIGFFRFLR